MKNQSSTRSFSSERNLTNITPLPARDKAISDKERKLLDVKAEIKSKKRLRDQMSSEISGNITDAKMQSIIKKLEDEVLVRDKQIDIINDKLIMMDFKLREKGSGPAPDSKALAKKEKEKTALQEEMKSLQETIRQQDDTILDLQGERDKIKTEMQDTMNDAQEKHRIENDLLVSKVAKKDNEIKTMRQEIIKLNKNYEQVNELNTQLNERVESLEAELEKKLTDAMRSTQTIREFGAKDAQIVDLTEENKRLNKQIEILHQACDGLQIAKVTTDNFVKQQEYKIDEITRRLELEIEKCKRLEQELSSTESELLDQIKEVRAQLESSLSELLDLKSQLQSVNDKYADDKVESNKAERSLKTELDAMSTQLRNKDMMISNQKKNEEVLNERIQELEDFVDKIKEKQAQDSKRQAQIVKALKDENTTLRTKQEKKRAQQQELQSAAESANLQLNAIQKRSTEMTCKIEAANARVQQLEREQRDSRSKLIKLKDEILEKDKNTAVRDKKLRVATAKVKGMEEELSTKDSEILEKESKIGKLNDELTELKKKLTAANLNEKNRQIKENKMTNARIEELEEEISILKEMIRGSQKEISQKNTDLLRYRRKVGELPKANRNVSPAPNVNDTSRSRPPVSRRESNKTPIQSIQSSQSASTIASPAAPTKLRTTKVSKAINSYFLLVDEIRDYEFQSLEKDPSDDTITENVQQKLTQAKTELQTSLNRLKLDSVSVAALSLNNKDFNSKLKEIGEEVTMEQILNLV